MTVQHHEDYNVVFGIMIEALQSIARKGISRERMIPVVVDFVTAITLFSNGEDGVRDVMDHMHRRINQWRAGTFPNYGESGL